MKVLVCGGRKYADARMVFDTLDVIAPTHVIHGGARGADALAGRWAQCRGVICDAFPADWNGIWGRRAGFVRNELMLRERPDLVVAFRGGRGTGHMVEIARKAGVPVREVLDHSLEYMLS